MFTRYLVAMVVGAAGVLLAAACGQDPEGPPSETKDDGDFGSDPDVGGNIGGVSSEPNWSFSPPSSAASDGDSAGDPDPDPGTSSDRGGALVGGYAPGNRVRVPCGRPPETCEEKCDRDFESYSGNCSLRQSAAERRRCQGKVIEEYASCKEGCAEEARKKTCLDMYEDCISRGPPCTKEHDYNYVMCSRCMDNCRNGAPYKFKQCKQCGFE
jgi:hypothetical protein